MENQPTSVFLARKHTVVKPVGQTNKTNHIAIPLSLPSSYYDLACNCGYNKTISKKIITNIYYNNLFNQ